MEPLIELDGLTVRLGGRTILHDLHAKLAGRAVGLLGPNGAGKSTLINTLLGFHSPSAGGARVLGLDLIQDWRALRAQVGFMPENDAFISGMSGIRSVCLMAELSGLPPETALERAHEALFLVGLGEARYRRVGTYSQGMKQLAKLAQALAHGPRLLFLDEPTNGLDPAARDRMLKSIREIRDSGETRLLISSHLLRDVEDACDEVLILKDGRIAAHCDIAEERRTNRKFLDITIAGANGRFVGAIEGLGCECAVFEAGDDRQRVKVVLPPQVEIRALYEVAAAQDVAIQMLSYRRDSLEDIFLAAMRNGTTGGADGRP
jgi:ABC-2 type transport system ATP-binding protein